MKYCFFAVISTMICVQLLAQDMVCEGNTLAKTDTIEVVLLKDMMNNAIIHQDSMIDRLMLDKRLGRQRGLQELNGFRVQVYSSNQQQVAKNEAISLQQDLKDKLDYPIYIISEPPFWKVRIGNFLTREEANTYKELLLVQYPNLCGSTYIVPDKITILY
jgi:hypothetical protein